MKKGELYIISSGVGQGGYLTSNTLRLLEKSELIVGYKKYIQDIQPLIKNKLSANYDTEVYSTGMTQEVDRCKYAIKQALNKKRVAIISNGDANIYGMAGLVLEIIETNNLWEDIEVFIEPGLTTLLVAAAKVGAPIMSDFAVVSLSDLLTPLEIIELRLKNALTADFVLSIYNPLSKTRKKPYLRFLEILKDHSKPKTPVIIAQNLGRDNEKIWLKTVEELIDIKDDLEIVNMSTILIIGNSTSMFVNSGNKIITKRGYQLVYDYNLQ
ncbi:MAG: precorrin-3B C(17)-methyltransferase [bacterium]